MSRRPKTGLTAKLREAAREFSGVFTADQLVSALDIRTFSEVRTIHPLICNLVRGEEFERVREGVYRHASKVPRTRKVDVMWRLFRAKKQFKTEEIERLSGAASSTVRFCCRDLQKTGILRKVGAGRFQLLNDPGPATPDVLSNNGGVR
jgi:predicted transcriptional regulator of viral defense system